MATATTQASRAPALLELAQAEWQRPDGRATLVGLVGGLGLLGVIFAANFQHFLYAWTTDDNYSHGFLVPFISLYFVNRAAQRGPVEVRSGVGLGLTLLGLSMFGRLATVLVPVPFAGDLALLIGIAGVCALVAGTAVLRRYAFAIFFLVFMVPLPIALYTQIASPLQFGVSRVASEVLNLTGLPVLREGNRMTLPGGAQMFVAEACSGMRQLTGFIALTAAVAYLSARPLWYRAALVASAIPVAMTANTARVVLTGYIMHYNPAYASGTFHTLEGLLMMGFGLSLLRAESWVLDQVVLLVEGPATDHEPAPYPSSHGRREGTGFAPLPPGEVGRAAAG